MPKKVFDPNKIITAAVRISNWYFDFQNRAFKVSFDIRNVIFGYFLNAKEGF